MWDKIKDFFKKAWEWIKAMWEKHDDALAEMVAAILPMVISMAFRSDLTGDQKKKAIVDGILDNAVLTADKISTSMLNEAVEIAANRYKIQIGTLTKEKIDAAKDAALAAGQAFANDKLNLTGTEAEDAGIVVNNADVG